MISLKDLLQKDNLIIQASQEYPIDPSIAFWGGMGVVVKEISERLVKAGYEILVLPRKTKEYASSREFYQEQNGVHILSLPIKSYQAGEENVDLYNYYPLKEGITSLDHCYTTWRYLEKIGMRNPIVHAHDWMSAAFMREAKRMKYQSVFTFHLSTIRNSGISGMRLADKRLELERLAGNDAQTLHYVSLAQMKDCQIYHWNEDKKQVVIPNGVNIEKYVPLLSSTVEDYVLFVGRLSPIKNVPQLILGWSEFNKKYPNVRLKILGASGVSNSDVLRIIGSLSSEQRNKIELRIEMVSEKEKIKYYQNSSVCCFPSSREAFGIVAIEAQSCGKAVVVGDTGGFKENVLEGVTGVHVRGHDPKSIAKGLELAYLNRTTWGKNARKLMVEFFSWDKLIELYIKELYGEREE